MTKKDADIIKVWLEKNPLVRAELILDKVTMDYDLRISKPGEGNEREYVIIGIPLSHEEESGLI